MFTNNKIIDIERQINSLEGDIIKEIFKNGNAIAFLHQTISSPRGDYFRRRLLQLLATETNISEIEKLRSEAQMQESPRHINKLSELQLISSCKEDTYQRTEKGEKVVNALRALETELGKEEAKKIFTSVLGPNSIRFFLRVYSSKSQVDLKKKQIKFSPKEIGKLSLFLPRTIEGVAAIDKLSDAELLVYKDDGSIYLDPVKARSFYKYLKLLHQM